MSKPDEGHRLTDIELAKLERRIAELYREARDGLDKTVQEYFAALKDRDKHQQELLKAGEITEEQYKQWRLNQIGRGKRFEALRDTMAERYTDANEVAVAYVNDETPGIYSLNRNYAAYTIEAAGADVSFTLFDEQTVKRLMVEQPDLMPYYPEKRALRRGIDLAYGKTQITASVTSGILQGNSIGKIANDLQSRMEDMSRASAIRTARTAVTGAQNAGRQDTYVSARKMGIKLEREWLATLDNRTRHAHAMLDGQRRAVDKPFQVDGQEIMFPGDPKAKGYLVYNCRCTLIAAVKGVDTSDAKRRARDPETGESVLIKNMTFQEWEGWKKAEGMSAGGETTEPGKPVQIGAVDFADKKKVIQRLNEVEKRLVILDYEVNCTVTADGKVWMVTGEEGTVNPSAIPSSLKGSYSYHNHPASKTHYSFSAADVAFFMESGEEYAKASDHLFEYVMRRTGETVEMERDIVYHRFYEIDNKEVLEMKWTQRIDPDLDEYHETCKLLCKELGIAYERKKKNQ